MNFKKARYIDTNLLHYLSFNGDAMKFTWYFLNFPLLLTLLAFLNKFLSIAFDYVPEKSIWDLFESLPHFEAIALAFGSCPNPYLFIHLFALYL